MTWVVVDYSGAQVDGPFALASEAEQRAANWEDSTGKFHLAFLVSRVDNLSIKQTRRLVWVASRALGILAPWER